MNRRSGDTVSKASDVEAIVGRTGLAMAVARSVAADMWFRGAMVFVVCGVFIWLNAGVMGFVRDAFTNDSTHLLANPPMAAADRLVTSNVVMALIGATVVQTGIGFIAIVSYLFPKRPA